MVEAPETDVEPTGSTFSRRRAVCLLFAFCLWSLLVIARLSHFMVFGRDHFLAAMERESWREGTIPPLRGRLLDRDGRPLAWSTRHFTLMWSVPEDAERAEQIWEGLCAEIDLSGFGTCEAVASRCGDEVELRRDLSAEEITGLLRLLGPRSGLRLSSTFVRHRLPQAGSRLGQVTPVDGIQVGVSGYEKMHDGLLRGYSGTYRVMVDKRGNWIPETWRKVREIHPGYDVYLPLRQED